MDTIVIFVMCDETKLKKDKFSDEHQCSLVPRLIPSFSACSIEILGMGLGTRLGGGCV